MKYLRGWRKEFGCVYAIYLVYLGSSLLVKYALTMHVPQPPDSWTPSVLSGSILVLTSSQYPIDTQERLHYLSASVTRAVCPEKATG